ncbi:MAG: RNA polymerase sigma factor [Blastocatellia bacterium]
MTPKQNTNPVIDELIRQFKQGSNQEDCFQHIFTRYSGMIRRFFMRKGMPPEDCNDLTQETFLSVFRGLKDFRQEAQFESWLFTIATNTFYSELEMRKAKKRAAVTISLDQEYHDGDGDSIPIGARIAAPGLSPAEMVLEQEKLELLREVMQLLPDQMRRCITLRVVHDLSYQEIADHMGIALGTVKAHIHQARKALQERLSPYFSEIEI